MIWKKFAKIFEEKAYFNFLDYLWYGLKSLRFEDNFESFTITDLSLTAGTEEIISNQLKVIPTKRIILKKTTHASIIDGVWDLDNVRITSDTNTVITIVFMA